MTVYVDDWQQQARVGRLNTSWSHLTIGAADDLAELHAFARRIGLRRAWFQGEPGHRWPRQHYDLTESKRARAIAAGAVAIPFREAARQRSAALAAHRALRAAGEADPPAWVAPASEPLTYLHRVDATAVPDLAAPVPSHGAAVCGRPFLVAEGWIVTERRGEDGLCAVCCFPEAAAAAERRRAAEATEGVLF